MNKQEAIIEWIKCFNIELGQFKDLTDSCILVKLVKQVYFQYPLRPKRQTVLQKSIYRSSRQLGSQLQFIKEIV